MKKFLLLALISLPALAAEAPKSWQAKMQALAKVTNELLPELVARKPDRQVLLKQAKALADLSHALTEDAARKMTRPPGDSDASLPLIAGQFADESKRAYTALKQGNVDYGTVMLKSVTSHCIACHSRHDAGPSFPSFPLSPKTKKLDRAELADLLMATRQFDKAAQAYVGIVADGKFASSNTIEWERAVRHGLSLAVRVKKSPELALEIVEKVIPQAAAPEFLRRHAERWKAAIVKWKAEPAIPEGATEDALLQEAEKRLREAQAAQEYPADSGATIGFLRASAAAHDLLGRFPDGKHVAEALYIAGTAYSVLTEPSLWSSHELYYEACVNKAPHSALAEKCYLRFEESIYFGYSGSGGTFIPEDVRGKMDRLKALATPGAAPKS